VQANRFLLWQKKSNGKNDQTAAYGGKILRKASVTYLRSLPSEDPWGAL
jgi:hypothetical protein